MTTLERISKQVNDNAVVLYMKGTPQFPSCGFSSRAAAALSKTQIEFAYVNVLDDAEIFQHLPEFANWPTFPQLYIKGELIGGCDIVLELSESGELDKMMQAAVA